MVACDAKALKAIYKKEGTISWLASNTKFTLEEKTGTENRVSTTGQEGECDVTARVGSKRASVHVVSSTSVQEEDVLLSSNAKVYKRPSSSSGTKVTGTVTIYGVYGKEWCYVDTGLAGTKKWGFVRRNETLAYVNTSVSKASIEEAVSQIEAAAGR